MKPARFDYQAPTTLESALDMLAKPGAKVLAGGQSLMPLLNMRLAFPETIVDINRLENLSYVVEDDERVRVGALTRQSDFGSSTPITTGVPLAARCVRHIGHFVTRNQGTVGGSLAHADSRGELPVVLSALGGSVTAMSARGQRDIEASGLFVTEFTTSLEDDEILVESTWPVLGEGWGYAFEEVAIRHGDYALAMVAVALKVVDELIEEARVVAGSVADRPLSLHGVSAALIGVQPGRDVLQVIAETARSEVDPAGDIHASGDYRRHLLGVLVARAVRQAWSEASNA